MPDFYLFGGPHGAGKTTLALKILPELSCREFVDADLIAQGLSPLQPEKVVFEASGMWIRRLRELAESNISFGTEHTLSKGSLVPLIKECKAHGYTFNLIYVWLPNAEIAAARVAIRLAELGRDVDKAEVLEYVRPSYEAGQRRFREMFLPLADWWECLDNSGESAIPVAQGHQNHTLNVYDAARWNLISAPHEGLP
jgi:predicted ABC-type ATPase